MIRRPIAVTVVGWLMMAAGAFGLVRGFMYARTLWPPEHDLIWIVLIDGAGIVCGAFLLRGRNWARWLTLVWIGGHVAVISVLNHRGILVHALIFAMIGYLLVFRGDVREYFRGERLAG